MNVGDRVRIVARDISDTGIVRFHLGVNMEGEDVYVVRLDTGTDLIAYGPELREVTP